MAEAPCVSPWRTEKSTFRCLVDELLRAPYFLGPKALSSFYGGFSGAGRQVIGGGPGISILLHEERFPIYWKIPQYFAEEGNEHFPLAEKLKRRWRMKPTQG